MQSYLLHNIIPFLSTIIHQQQLPEHFHTIYCIKFLPLDHQQNCISVRIQRFSMVILRITWIIMMLVLIEQQWVVWSLDAQWRYGWADATACLNEMQIKSPLMSNWVFAEKIMDSWLDWRVLHLFRGQVGVMIPHKSYIRVIRHNWSISSWAKKEEATATEESSRKKNWKKMLYRE